MVKFEYQGRIEKFDSWYDAAKWLYERWQNFDRDISYLIDNSQHVFYGFSAWVDDNYSAYDILSRAHDGLYEELYERYFDELADDLADDVYDFCIYFKEI